jgi:hypothetical protein
MKAVKGTDRSTGSPALRDTHNGRLLDRLLDIPDAAHSLSRLPPELLHRVIQSCGLEDCGELVALATPEQLACILDVDLWRTAQSGSDEQFDADRFGVWVEVLMECGPSVAAHTLASMDVDLVVAGLAHHTRVFDVAAVAPCETTDGDQITPIHTLDDALVRHVGGYVLAARRTDSWDAIVSVLMALEDEHQGYFRRVMRGCRMLSNSRPEIDGLHDLLADTDQGLFDLACERERRREKRGYVTPAQARAFLDMSRQLQLASDAMPPASPVARACLQAIQQSTVVDGPPETRLPARSDGSQTPGQFADAVAAAVEVLHEAGVLAPPPRALLDGSHDRPPRLQLIQMRMQFARDCDDLAFATRSGELAFLANALMAGCSIQARPIEVQEASDATFAVCNLGLENWPRRWLRAHACRDASVPDSRTSLPDDFLVGHDLVTVFQVGWAVLHQHVGMYAAERLIAVLSRFRCDDRHVRAELDALRVQMTRHRQAGAPWRARQALDVITTLDMPAWAALLGLLDECPVIHAGLTAARSSRTYAVPASAFEFISENSQIATVREFMESLPRLLCC